ncbi:MAG: hypothetical protein ACREGC_04310, partial [Minisyncoccia bacterium]
MIYSKEKKSVATINFAARNLGDSFDKKEIMSKRSNTLRSITILVIGTIIICSCSTTFHDHGRGINVAQNAVEIKPFVGVGNVDLGTSDFRDVQRVFGKGKKHWHYESIFDLGEFYWERTIDYPELGISFAAARLYRFTKFAVATIEMDSSCKFKTKMGNGIGSKLSDLRNEFGSLRVIHWTTTEGEYEDATV